MLIKQLRQPNATIQMVCMILHQIRLKMPMGMRIKQLRPFKATTQMVYEYGTCTASDTSTGTCQGRPTWRRVFMCSDATRIGALLRIFVDSR